MSQLPDDINFYPRGFQPAPYNSMPPRPYGPVFLISPTDNNVPQLPALQTPQQQQPNPMMMPMGYFQPMQLPPQRPDSQNSYFASQPQMYPPMFFTWAGNPMGYEAYHESSAPSTRDSDYSECSLQQQQPPDVVASKSRKRSSRRFSKRKPTMSEPDVISKAPPEPPLYSKLGELPRAPSAPFYSYLGEHSEKDKVSRFARGASLPPMICDELAEMTGLGPIPPPRSRRGSTLSLNKSSHSLHLAGLSDRLASFKSALDALKSEMPAAADKLGGGGGSATTTTTSAAAPSRPPRRSDRFKKKCFSGMSTLPRNFKTVDLGIISEDENATEPPALSLKPTVPMPGPPLVFNSNHVPKDLTENPSQLQRLPKIPMPGSKTFDAEIIITPKKTSAPPSPISASMNLATIDAPVGHSNFLFPSLLDGNLRHDVAFVAAGPPSPKPQQQRRDSDGAIYEEVEMVKKAVLKINVNPVTNGDGITIDCCEEVSQIPIAEKREERKSEGDAESLRYGKKLPNDDDSSTEYEEIDECPIKEAEDKDAHKVTRSSSSSSIHQTRNELLEGIKNLDMTIESLKVGMIKVYEDVYARPMYAKRSQLENKTLEPVEAEIVETIDSTRKIIEAHAAAADVQKNEDVTEGITFREHESKAFRKSFFGINEVKIGLMESDELPTVLPSRVSECTQVRAGDTSVGRRPVQDICLGEVFKGEEDDDWQEWDNDTSGVPIFLGVQHTLSSFRSLKDELLSSLFQHLYPSDRDCLLVNRFISCPVSLDAKYSMMRLGDILAKNKRGGVELEVLVEAMGQLARVGQELLRPEAERDPSWRIIKVAKEITVVKGIAQRAPWEKIQGGTEILESLGYTEYTGFSLQYPRSALPEFFSDHIGSLTVELVLATAEISTLIVHSPPSLEALKVLQESEAFPGNDPEEVPMSEDEHTEIQAVLSERIETQPMKLHYQNCMIDNSEP